MNINVALPMRAKNSSHYGVHRDHHPTVATAVDKLEHLRLAGTKVPKSEKNTR